MDGEQTNLTENRNIVTPNLDIVTVLMAMPACKGVSQ
jgi:hypothetical protein